MAVVSKIKKIADFYLPELLNHFRSMSEHRFTPIEFSVIKKVLLSVIHAQDRIARIEQIGSAPSLAAFYQFLRQILDKAEKDEIKISQLIANIESDSEKLSNIFTQILPAHVDLDALETELQAIGIAIDLAYLKKTYLQKSEDKKVTQPVPPVKKETALPPKKTAPAEFGKVDDMIGFLNSRGKKTPVRKKDDVAFDEVIDMTAAAVKDVFGKKTPSKIDPETMSAFREEAASYTATLSEALARLRKQDDRFALKEIQQALRGLNTAAKLLRLKTLTDLNQAMLTAFNKVTEKAVPAPTPLLELSDETIRTLQSLLQGTTIADETFSSLANKFSQLKFEAAAKPEPVVEKTKPAEKPVVKAEAKPTKQAAADLAWVDTIQDVIDHNFSKTSATVTEAEPVVEMKKTTRPAESIADEIKTIEPEAEIKKAVPVSRKKPSPPADENVLEPEKLLDLMASHDPDVDLTQMKVPTFIEKMSVEPEDIIAPAAKKTKKKKAKAPTQKTEPVVSKTPPVKEPPKKDKGKETVQPTVTEETPLAGNILKETFAEMDTEILEIFEQEAGSYFKMFDKSIEKLRSNLKDENAIKELERASHSLKSSSRMLGFEKISGLSACIELITERFFENELVLDAPMLQLLYDIIIALKQLFNRAAVDAGSIAERLIALEQKLATPDIFIRNLPNLKPGAVPAPAARPAVEETPAEEKPAETKTDAKDYFAMTGIDEEIVQIFKEEAAAYMKTIGNALLTLKKDLAKTTVVRDIEKSAHSLRSSAKMLGFQKISNLARPIEVLAERINKKQSEINSDTLSLFDDSAKLLKSLVSGTDVEIEAVLERLSTAEKQPVMTAASSEDQDAGIKQLIKNQLGVTPADQPTKKESEAVVSTKKTAKKEVKKLSKDFTDIKLDADPILKRLFTGETELLNEMAESSQSLK